MARERLPLIKVVGVSAAGKSTLVEALRRLGYDARPASQEHSQIPDMWRRIRPPTVLIYLDADVETQRRRRPDVSWDEAWLAVERERLAHARAHADLYIDTRDKSKEQVLARVLAFLQAQGIAHADHPLPPLPRTGGSRPPPSPADTPEPGG